MSRTVADVISSIQRPPAYTPLPTPRYTPGESSGDNYGLAVYSMKDHTTDEGWQLFQALYSAGYFLCGEGIGSNLTDIREIASFDPQTIVVQDKREWDTGYDFRDPKARFWGIEALRSRPDIFKLTVLKDAQQRPDYHRESAEEMGCHAWIIYYHPRIVSHLAGYVRPQHLIRTYHSIDRTLVPPSPETRLPRALLSGAISGVYPIRQAISQNPRSFPLVDVLPHPGYHRDGCATPSYLATLSQYEVAICTSSIYGYTLRKIIEATACGCRVITDLPVDDPIPWIDGNLTRISHLNDLNPLIRRLLSTYSPEDQEGYAQLARRHYDYQVLGTKLARDIETMRRTYVD